MSFFHVLSIISASSILSSRSFLPLFLVCYMSSKPAWIMEFLPQFVLNSPMFRSLGFPDALSFLGHPASLSVIAILAICEMVAEKDSDIQEFLNTFTVYTRTAVALLVSLQMLPPETGQILVQNMGATADSIVLGITLILTFSIALVRQKFYTFWIDSDADDVLGLRRLFSWVEEFWAFGGIMSVLLFPLLAIISFVVIVGIVFVVNRVLAHLENLKRIACKNCDYELMVWASQCPKCQCLNDEQQVLTWHTLFAGQPASPEQAHRFRLLAKARCPSCAEKMGKCMAKSPSCKHCKTKCTEVLGKEWLKEYVRFVKNRSQRHLLPIFLLSFIPILGSAIALVWMRLVIGLPLRPMMRATTRIQKRLTLRILAIAMLLLGALPFVSVLVIPVFYLLYSKVYFGEFLKQEKSHLLADYELKSMSTV